MLSCKNVQHVKIYPPCNFEVNPITHFWSYFPFFIIFFLIIPAANKVWEVYRNHPVRPSMYLVSATPPKRLIRFL